MREEISKFTTMHIANARQSKRKWFYFVLPYLFFLLSISNDNSNEKIQEMINHWGELPFFAMGLFTFVVLLITLFIVVKYIHNQSITSFSTGRKKFDFKRFLFAFGVWGGLTIGSIAIDYWLNPQDFVWNFQLKPFISLMAISLILIPFQTGFEEYFFRGYLLQGMGIICNKKWLPLIISSVAFGLVHIANPEINKFGYEFLILYIIMGFSMGIMTLMDNGLELAWGMHTANNFFVALLLTAEWTAFQTPSLLKQIASPSFGGIFILSILVYNIILLYIFAKKYHWTNWKENLFGTIVSAK